jgi:hypothetical protein
MWGEMPSPLPHNVRSHSLSIVEWPEVRTPKQMLSYFSRMTLQSRRKTVASSIGNGLSTLQTVGVSHAASLAKGPPSNDHRSVYCHKLPIASPSSTMRFIIFQQALVFSLLSLSSAAHPVRNLGKKSGKGQDSGKGKGGKGKSTKSSLTIMPTLSSAPSFQPSSSQAPSSSIGPSDMPSLIPSGFPSLSSAPSCVGKGKGKAGSKKMGQKSGKAASSVKASMTGQSTKGGKKRNRGVKKSDGCDSSSSSEASSEDAASSEDEEEEEIEESVVISYANALENAPSGTMPSKPVGAATLTGLVMLFALI